MKSLQKVFCRILIEIWKLTIFWSLWLQCVQYTSFSLLKFSLISLIYSRLCERMHWVSMTTRLNIQAPTREDFKTFQKIGALFSERFLDSTTCSLINFRFSIVGHEMIQGDSTTIIHIDQHLIIKATIRTAANAGVKRTVLTCRFGPWSYYSSTTYFIWKNMVLWGTCECSVGFRGGGGAQQARTPPPQERNWINYFVCIPFCIRMLKDKAQIAQERASKTCESFQGP